MVVMMTVIAAAMEHHHNHHHATTTSTSTSSTAASNVCYTAVDAARLVGVAGLTLWVVTLVEAALAQGYPLWQLGIRPMGRNLWESNYHYVQSGKGVMGYDPIQGAFSPHLRLQIHLASLLLTWSAAIFALLSHFPNEILLSNCTQAAWFNLPRAVWMVGALATAAYCSFFYYMYHVLPGVSVPGGPRQQKIRRTPMWEDKSWDLPSLKNWHMVVADESHQVSSATFAGTRAVLTGEPAGRDVWTTMPQPPGASSSEQKAAVDEALVQELASGGREPGFNPSRNPNSADVPFRQQQIREYLRRGGKPPSMKTTAASTQNGNGHKNGTTATDKLADVLHRAVHFYSMLQTHDGHWSGDYGGPHFLLPGLIVAWYCMGRPSQIFSQDALDLMIPYIVTHQQADGGWGTHLESPSTMFGTTLMYVAIRCLGVPKTDPVCRRGRMFLEAQGGAVMTSSWAKFYLCLLGVMEWEGHNVVPPEMWLLPNWCPFHPGRMWCHSRMVYLPMGYLFGSKFVYKDTDDPLIQSLREELYCQPYDSIDWINTRHMVAPMDNYSPVPWIMKFLQNCLACYETWAIFQPFKNFVRKRGLKFCADYMHAEDLQTNFINIGPVNKVLNMLAAYNEAGCDVTHKNVANHMVRVSDYMWVAEDGMKMKGYNGSQCWDSSFAIQAVYEAGLVDAFPDMSKKVWSFLERCQILSTEISQNTVASKYEAPEWRKKYYRHVSEGGWPFSTSAHGWPITDCTGEGLKGVLCLMKSKSVKEAVRKGELRDISNVRLRKAVNVLLAYQNEDGGFATYENTRGFGWYEYLNPSEVFGDIMIDYSYVECSMATLTALVDFQELFPKHREDEVSHAIAKGREFLKSIQRHDGSWYGSWACCFCYGCWFGVEGLVKCGESLDSPSIIKACEFLLKHQRPNGGWGEDFTSCYNKDYAKDGMKAYGDDGSGVVNTAWALLALSVAECIDVEAIKRGVLYLKRRQLPSGDWPQEGIAGVFNRACGITYTAYRNVFPIWALGRCRAVFGEIFDD